MNDHSQSREEEKEKEWNKNIWEYKCNKSWKKLNCIEEMADLGEQDEFRFILFNLSEWSSHFDRGW